MRHDGSIKWGSASVFVGEAFAGEIVGLEKADDGRGRRDSGDCG